ncbi:MAG: hypothetical protein QGF74_02065 [Candidatus Nanoarchaeia archaeon]|nr:hypothetical protein [Candidatus Nanoarchaeia archaeon]
MKKRAKNKNKELGFKKELFIILLIFLSILLFFLIEPKYTGFVVFQPSTHNWTFDDSNDYTFNSNLINLTNGEVNLTHFSTYRIFGSEFEETPPVSRSSKKTEDSVKSEEVGKQEKIVEVEETQKQEETTEESKQKEEKIELKEDISSEITGNTTKNVNMQNMRTITSIVIILIVAISFILRKKLKPFSNLKK